MFISARLIVGLGVALGPWQLAVPTSANEQFAVSSIINVPGGLSAFDIGFVDPVAGLYVLADSGNASVDVVDTGSNAVISQLQPGFVGVSTLATCPGFANGRAPNCSGPNGVLIANQTQVWVGDGQSRVWKVKLSNGHVLARISTALPTNPTDPTRAHKLCYDPDDQIILVANDASKPWPFVTFISSTNSPQVLGHIVMNGKSGTPQGTGGIAQCQYDPRTGKFYLNVPQATIISGGARTPKQDLVLQIDPISEKVLNTVNITKLDSNCVGLRGMAIGPSPQIALGCSSGGDAVVISEAFSSNSTAVIAKLSGESGTDENWFNPGDTRYFFANGNPKLLGVVAALGETGSGSPMTDSIATSASGSYSVAADSVANQVYVPINNGKGAASKICSSNIDANGNPGVDTNGCIAVFTEAPSNGSPSSSTGSPSSSTGSPSSSTALQSSSTGSPLSSIGSPSPGNGASVPDVTSFSGVNGSTIYVDNAPYDVHNPNKPYNLTNPDPQTLRFEAHSKEWWSLPDGSYSDLTDDNGAERSSIQKEGNYPRSITINISYQFMVEPGNANTASFFQFLELFDETSANSPPFEIDLQSAQWSPDGNGDHMMVEVGWFTKNGTPTSNGSPINCDSNTTMEGQSACYGYAYLDPSPIQRGHWYSMQIQINHAAGTLIVIRDGIQLFNYHGTLGFGSTDTYHLEYGIYRGPTTNDIQAVQYRNMVVSP